MSAQVEVERQELRALDRLLRYVELLEAAENHWLGSGCTDRTVTVQIVEGLAERIRRELDRLADDDFADNSDHSKIHYLHKHQ